MRVFKITDVQIYINVLLMYFFDQVTFDKLAELKYMDRFINESLRSTTVVPQLERLCTKNYKLPGRLILIFTLQSEKMILVQT